MAVEFDGPDGAEGIDHQDDSDPVAGLRKATQAEREKRQDAERRAQELETQVAELRGRVEGMAATHKPEKTSQPEWTSAQLRQAVEEGRLSEDQAEEIKFKQAEARVRESVTKEVRQELTTNEMKAKIGGEIARYNASVPDINDRTSQAFAKLQGEYRYLVSLGHDPNDAKTELLAARAAFGPVEALEKSG
ncbi:MAG TPA: hypothetical protein VLV83_25085, partial [Acidobacteriota bacterium]|nr:hypothetical protein [Acidobacteriota bacterium]